MKKYQNDPSSALERFGRDRRQRTTSAERVERRPRPEAAATHADAEARPRRASYNPHFTADNRPVSEGRPAPRRTASPRYGREQQDDAQGYAPRFRDEHPSGRPGYGRKPARAAAGSGYRPAGRSYNYEGAPEPDFNRYDAAEGYGDRPSRGGRPTRTPRTEHGGRSGYGSRPAHADRSDRGDRKGRPAYGAGSRNGARRDDKPKSYPRYNADKLPGEMRLNRFIAQSGICSRREADDFITAGLVTVNGVVVTELGTKVKSTDEVKFNDSRVQGEKKVYLVLNKPKGYVTSLEDSHADKLVSELIKGACAERVYPVGRLDKNSVGLLLFTNDGDLTRQLTHPSYQKKKIYQVSLDAPLTRADMDAIAAGVELEDGMIFADEISYVKENKKEIGIEIHSGRNRIVRRIFEHFGYTVQKLDRVYYAGLTKKNLKRGQWRFLTRDEVQRLKSGMYE